MGKVIRLGPWPAGLNLRDDPRDLAPGEVQGLTKYTPTEKGTLRKFAATADAADFPNLPAGPTKILSMFWSEALNLLIVQGDDNKLYKCARSGSWSSFRTMTSTGVPLRMVDFAGKLVYIHPVDGVRTYDGTTDAAATYGGGSTIGSHFLAVWQNRVWTAVANRIYWSNLGNAGVWNQLTDFVDLREKDDENIVGLFASSGLLAFKERSTYRINDSTTGAYQTIDWAVGSVGPATVVALDGKIYNWGKDGLYEGDGIGPWKNVGDRVRPIFLSDNITKTNGRKMSAVAAYGRVYFSFPYAASMTTELDAILEFNPRTKAVAIAQFSQDSGSLTVYTDTNGKRIPLVVDGYLLVKTLFAAVTAETGGGGMVTGHVVPFGGKAARLISVRPLVSLDSGHTMTVSVTYAAPPDEATSAGWSSQATSGNDGARRYLFNPFLAGSSFYVTIGESNATLLEVHDVELEFEQIEL